MPRKHLFQLQAQKALTLIEGLLFLGIAAVVIVGAVVFYNNASSSSNVNLATSQIQALTSGIRTLHAGQPNFGPNNTNLTELAISTGIVPSSAVFEDTNIRNPWGGQIRIVSRNRFFTIHMDQIPRDSCIRLMGAGLMGEGAVVAVHRTNTNLSTTANPATGGNPTFQIPNSGTPGSTEEGNPITVEGINDLCAAGRNQLIFWVR